MSNTDFCNCGQRKRIESVQCGDCRQGLPIGNYCVSCGKRVFETQKCPTCGKLCCGDCLDGCRAEPVTLMNLS